MRTRLFCITAGTFAGMLLCIIAWQMYRLAPLYSLAITFGTCFYHMAMRLAVGYLIHACKHNRFDYRKGWFQPLPFEAAFYQTIHIRAWKKKIPTFQPTFFDVRQQSLENIIMATCQAEVVHEVIVVLSFLPLLAAIPFGAFAVFLITSLAAAATDMIFVLLQRYNRPRLMRLMKK
ncbi:MAG: hypothetical protein PUC41_00265 [Oscillospiraceae bacterium]|nr:hypothetical protein [Oscillospiraceae bacterium]